MPLPNSNLPSASLPWAREVENNIEAIKDNITKNDINNSARDAANETNIKNLSSLLTDLSELKTYSTSLDYYNGSFRTFVGSPGLPTPFDIDASALQKTIYITKPRSFLINFSSYYAIQTSFIANTDPYSWGINCQVFVDGLLVDTQTTSREVSATTSNGYSNEKGSINMVSVVPVSAGEHLVSMKISYYTSSNGATTLMGISGDNLVISVIQ